MSQPLSSSALDPTTESQTVDLEQIERQARDFAAFNVGAHDVTEAYNLVAARMHGLCAAVRVAEIAGADRARLRRSISPARRTQGLSPFIARLQAWPRGYAGDFETIEYRVWMEYFVDWVLVERSSEDVLRLCRAAGIPPESVSIALDATGLAHLVTITPGARQVGAAAMTEGNIR